MEFRELKNAKPSCFERGNWDGLRSDLLLIVTSEGEFEIGTAYGGIMDGREFLNFYDKRDYEIENVTHWAYLPVYILP
jgi:hypothetical protein